MLDLNITLLFQLVNFLVSIVVLNYLLIKPLRKIMRERKAMMAELGSEAEGFEAKAQSSLDKLMDSFGSASAAVETLTEPEKIMESLFESVKAEKGIYARVPYIYYFE